MNKLWPLQCYIIITRTNKQASQQKEDAKQCTFLPPQPLGFVLHSWLLLLLLLLLLPDNPVLMFACVYWNMHGVTPHHHKGPVMLGLPHWSHAVLLVHAVGRRLAAVQQQPLCCPNDVVWALRGGDVGGCVCGGGGVLLISNAPQHFS